MQSTLTASKLKIDEPSESVAGRIIRQITSAVDDQPMRHFPFAYTVIDDVLPEDVFRRAYDSLPSFEFINSQIKIEEGQYNNRLVVPFTTLKEHADPLVWSAIELAMLSDKFETLLTELFVDLMDDEARQRLTRPISRSITLNCDPPGSYLKPHTDSPEILLSFFIYLKCGSPHPSLNTVLYKPVDEVTRRQRIKASEYSHEEFADHVHVDQIKFKPNRSFCFFADLGFSSRNRTNCGLGRPALCCIVPIESTWERRHPACMISLIL